LVELENNGVGDRTRQLGVTILRMALQLAKDRGKVARNVAKTVERPSTTRKRRDAPDSNKVRSLLRAVQDDMRLPVFVLLTLGLGLRKGEALGLQWHDINLETGEITINRHVVHLNAAFGGLQQREGARTAAGERESPIHELLSTALQRLSRQQKEEYLAGVWAKNRAYRTCARKYDNPSAPPNDPRCWVLPTRSGTMPSPDNITRDLKALCVRAGLGDRQTIHGLRHDYASLLAELGVPQSDDLSSCQSYLSWWASALRDDPSCILRISTAASRAADFVLGFSRPREDAEEPEAAGREPVAAVA